MTLKDILFEILNAEISSAGKLPDIEQIKKSNENLTDCLKFILLWNMAEQNIGNAGNRYSLCVGTVEIHVVHRKAEASPDELREEVISHAHKVRSILKNNSGLICASAPNPGFAVRSEIGDVTDAAPDLKESIPSHSAIVPLRAWYFKNEAAA